MRRWYIREPITLLMLMASYTFMRAATLLPRSGGFDFGAQDVCMMIASFLAFSAGGFVVWATSPLKTSNERYQSQWLEK